MSFSRIPKVSNQLFSQNSFISQLTTIAEATTNLDDDIITVSTHLGMGKTNLTKMMLSSNNEMKTCVTILKNLTRTLPEQLNTQVNNLRERISEHKDGLDEVPDYLSVFVPDERIIEINENDENEQNENDNEENYSDQEYNNEEPKITLRYTILNKKTDEEKIKDDACPICLCLLKDTENMDEIVVVKCGHQFHCECIISCFKEKQTCPLCRSPI
jgi:hypothetical protein